MSGRPDRSAAAPGLQVACEHIGQGTGTDLPSGGFPVFGAHQEEQLARSDEKWSGEVTEHSDALDLEDHVFEQDDPKDIAASLKRSADSSQRRKAEPFRSAMSMLTFYINRAGSNLSSERRKILEQAKDELRKAYGKSGD